MAQRAFGILVQTSVTAGNSAQVDVDVIVCISGDDIGDYASGRQVIHLTGVNPAGTLKVDIEGLIKTELLAHGVPFGALDADTVRLY